MNIDMYKKRRKADESFDPDYDDGIVGTETNCHVHLSFAY